MSELNSIFEFFGFTDKEMFEHLSSVAEIRKYKTGEKIFGNENDSDVIMINIDGIQRVYYTNTEGTEFTCCFSCKFAHFLASNTYRLFDNTVLHVEALTHSTLVVIPASEFMNLCNKFSKLSKLYEALFHEDYISQIKHKLVIATNTAEDKYIWFLKNYPGLIDRIPHKYIASFLNITPVTLSRTRKKLKDSSNQDA